MLSGRQYYTLVAGLRELTVDGGFGSGLDAETLREEIVEDLSRADRRLVGLFFEWGEIATIEDPTERMERFEDYYDRCEHSHSRFLREWSRFDRDLRNAIAESTARGRGWEFSRVGAPPEDIPDYRAALGAALERSDIVEKERAIDLIRWQKADELSEFDTFGMPTILAYLVKIAIVGRWAALDPVAGRQMYDKLVDEMEAEIKIDNRNQHEK